MTDNNENIFDTSSFIDNVIETPVVERPDKYSLEWSDYVIRQFKDDELVEINGKKYPNCYGLRRLVELFIGEIRYSGVERVYHVDSNPPRTAVHYAVIISKHNAYEGEVEVKDVASVSGLNTDDLFLGYPEETASTRAEGRCLRKILGLRCVAAEELTQKKDVSSEVRNNIKSRPTDGSYDFGGRITDNQLRLLLNVSRQLKIDAVKFVNTKQQLIENDETYLIGGSQKFEKIEDVSKNEARKLIKLLTNYQNNSQDIPKEILL